VAGALFLTATSRGDDAFRLFPHESGFLLASNMEPAPAPLWDRERVFAQATWPPSFPFESESANLKAAAQQVVSTLEAPPRGPSNLGVALGYTVLALTLGGSAYNSWRGGSFSNFHFTDEFFFGRNTYTGGVDKASHFVDYNVASRVITLAYSYLGFSDFKSQLYGSGAAFLAGLWTEIGDGTTLYGFSYEDLTMDAFGTATAFGLAVSGWDDTIGFRIGRFSPDKTPACCYTNANYGRDYSGEMYMGDLKLDGAARRVGLRPGIARFFLLTMNYGTNGYRLATADIRQRLLGIEIGLNFNAFLREFKVPETTWWGRPLYLFFDCFRIPYTGVGFRYDLNHKKWYGPTAGYTPFETTGGM